MVRFEVLPTTYTMKYLCFLICIFPPLFSFSQKVKIQEYKKQLGIIVAPNISYPLLATIKGGEHILPKIGFSYGIHLSKKIKKKIWFDAGVEYSQRIIAFVKTGDAGEYLHDPAYAGGRYVQKCNYQFYELPFSIKKNLSNNKKRRFFVMGGLSPTIAVLAKRKTIVFPLVGKRIVVESEYQFMPMIFGMNTNVSFGFDYAVTPKIVLSSSINNTLSFLYLEPKKITPFLISLSVIARISYNF